MDYKRETNQTKKKILYPCLNCIIHYALFLFILILTIFFFGYLFYYIVFYSRIIYNNPEMINKEVEIIYNSNGVKNVKDEFILNMQISLLILVCILFIFCNLLFFQKYNKTCCTILHRIFLISLMIYFCYHTKLYIDKLKIYSSILKKQIVNESITHILSNYMKIIDFQKDVVAITILLIVLKCFYIVLLLLDVKDKKKDKNNLSQNLIEMENV